MWFVAALIPLVIGAIYYNDAVFGKTLKNVNGFSDDYDKQGNPAVIFGVSYLFCVLLAVVMTILSIHQGGAFSMMMPEVMESGTDAQKEFNALMATYGDNFRTFSHGLIHGILATVFFVLPILGTIALFERRGWKYIWLHTGYWLISLALMGGLLCATLKYAPLS